MSDSYAKFVEITKANADIRAKIEGELYRIIKISEIVTRKIPHTWFIGDFYPSSRPDHITAELESAERNGADTFYAYVPASLIWASDDAVMVHCKAERGLK